MQSRQVGRPSLTGEQQARGPAVCHTLLLALLLVGPSVVVLVIVLTVVAKVDVGGLTGFLPALLLLGLLLLLLRLRGLRLHQKPFVSVRRRLSTGEGPQPPKPVLMPPWQAVMEATCCSRFLLASSWSLAAFSAAEEAAAGLACSCSSSESESKSSARSAIAVRDAENCSPLE